MIDKEHLKVGNEVFVVWSNDRSGSTATITKVGRKYTYTTNRNLIIENSRLMTKHTGYGHSTYAVFKSEDEFNEHIKKVRFIREIELKLRFLNLNLAKARIINDALGLGVEE